MKMITKWKRWKDAGKEVLMLISPVADIIQVIINGRRFETKRNEIEKRTSKD